MDEKNPELTRTTKQRVQDIGQRAKERLDELLAEGLITELDYRKVQVDVETHANAVFEALEKQDLDEAMRTTLVEKLLDSYEQTLTETIEKIEQRRYSKRRINERIDNIEQDTIQALRNHPRYENLSRGNREKFHDFLREEKKRVSQTIFRISPKEPQYAQQVEDLIEGYNQTAQQQLSELTTMALTDDTSTQKNATPQTESVSSHPRGDGNETKTETNQGSILGSFFRWFGGQK